MNITSMREFVTLSKNLNYTQTAEELFITQSTLSRHISEMEIELDIKLFNRSTHGVELTKEGVFIFEEFNKIISQYDDMLSTISLRKEGNRESSYWHIVLYD